MFTFKLQISFEPMVIGSDWFGLFSNCVQISFGFGFRT